MVTKESFPRRIRWNGTPSENPSAHWPVAFGSGMTLVRSPQPLPGVMACRAEKNADGVTLTCLDAPKAPEKSLALRLLELLALWHHRWSTRRLLSGLDDRMLKDMGVSSIDALKESSKPFWLK